MIGVFDSGSGGLTILKALQARFPDQDFLYYGDHGNAPYGHRSNAQILALTKASVDLLMAAGCELVILACNTAAAVALRSLQQNWIADHWPGRRILGVLVPMVEAVTGQPWSLDSPSPAAFLNPITTDLAAKARQTIALFATRKTIESGAFRDELKKRAPHVHLLEKACPGLVDAIENGAGPKPLEALVAAYVDEICTSGPLPDAAILGCTHFPLVEHAFRKALPASTALYSQPDITALSLENYLKRHPRFLTKTAPSNKRSDSIDKGDLDRPSTARFSSKGRVRLWTSGEALAGPLLANLPKGWHFTAPD